MNRNILAIVAATTLAACGVDEAPPAAPAESAPTAETPVVEADPVKGIEWFDGSVEEAFAAAKEADKPIYLYWGAVWCPPCHAIAATVFRSPAFIERSKLFIPVYLDGDTENAQAYGEKFDVLGYPTMIIFDPDGRELTRIPGGIDIQAYANVLDLTLRDTAGVTDIVAAVLNPGAELSAADCSLLAYYSWGQDTQILADLDAADAFRRIYEACPADQANERSMLYLSWLDARLDAAADEDTDKPMSAEEKTEALERLKLVLADDELARANIFTVLFDGPRATRTLTEAGSEAEAELIAAYTAALDRIEADQTVYLRERLYTLVGRIRFERLHDSEAELSAELQQQIRDAVAWADESTPSVYERQPIINALGNILDEAGMDDVAKPLLLAELERSKQPYYFMVSLADIEQRAGNNEAAIEWLRKAHEVAQGPATRFQWGYYYLTGLIEMAPGDSQRIHDVTVALIDELQNSIGLHKRPKAQFARLESNLVTWGEENDEQKSLQRIRKSVLQVCAAAVVQDASRQTCETFLESA